MRIRSTRKLFVVVLLRLLLLCRAWRWDRMYLYSGFQARDGACSFTFFNRSDRTFRVGIFGGTTVTGTADENRDGSVSARKAFNDVWFSPPLSQWFHKDYSSGRRKGVWIKAEPEREKSSTPGVPGPIIGEWPEARWDHQCNIFEGDPRVHDTSVGRNSNASHNSSSNSSSSSDSSGGIITTSSPFTLFVTGGQRPGRNNFLGENSGDAWNMTVVDIHAPTPVVRWTRLNTSLYGEAWAPRYGHCTLYMRVKGFWQKSLNGARIQSIEDSYELKMAEAKTDYEIDYVNSEFEADKRQKAFLGQHSKSAITGVVILMGGLTKYGFRGDVWLSSDRGETWERRHNRAFSGRYFHGCAPLGTKSILIMGGRSRGSSSSLSDVHRSEDFGRTWVRITAAAQWEKRYRFATSAFIASNTVVTTARATQSSSSSVDSTGDFSGLGNSKASDNTNLVPQSAHLVLISGGYRSGDSKFFNDMWATNDGIHWTKQSWDAPILDKWSGRSGHVCVGIPGTADTSEKSSILSSGGEAQIRNAPAFVLIGGRNKAERLSDTWIRRAGPVVLTNDGLLTNNTGFLAIHVIFALVCILGAFNVL